MGLKRREFLQQASTLLAALGMTEAGLWRAGDRYLQALAEPTSRKLALLVGINDYATGTDLGGCLTDVELQRELLIYRFGFQRSDILTLTDAQATRKNIEEAFLNHLTQQVQSGDVVVFHFSGYGRYLNQNPEFRRLLPESGSPESAAEITNALIPSDSALSGTPSEVNDLLEDTLLLLLRSLPTEKIIAVLDTSYAYFGSDLQGNLRVRSRPFPDIAQPSADELVIQQQLLARILPKEPKFNLNQLRGFVLTAAGPQQVATEMQLAGFSTGLFTYALTQQLWQATPATTLQFSLQQAACTVGQLAGIDPHPQLKGDPAAIQTEKKFSLFQLNALSTGIEGALKSVEDDGRTAQLWIGGLPARVLEAYGTNSLLRIVPVTNSEFQPPGLETEAKNGTLLQIRSRSGPNAQVQKLGATVKDTPPLKAGQFVQEAVRVLPRNPNLIVALDASLERIERVDATSAFSGISFVTPVVAGEQAADCVFGRVREMLIAQSSNPSFSTLSPGSYGLFWLGQDLIADTMGEGGEAVKAAVRRLVPQMQTLLAAKLWRWSANESSSRLAIRASLERLQENQPQVLTEKKALRVMGLAGAASGFKSNVSTSPAWKKPSVITIPAGSRIQYRLNNEGKNPLYFLLFGLDNRGRAYVGGLSEVVALYPKQLGDPNDLTQFQEVIEYNQIAPGESRTLPWTISGSGWRAGSGLAETHIICSSQPFYRTMAALASTMPPRADAQPLTVLSNPLPVAQALMQDLHQASEAGVKLAGISSDNNWALDVNVWATLSFVYRVV